MNDVLVPDWIKREEAQITHEKAQRDAETQRELAASILIGSDGPKFWQTLLEKFAINTDALPKIDLSGQTIKVSVPERGEQHWRIAVSRPGVFPSFTHTDVFYSLGSGVDLTGKICTRWNERESTWRKSGHAHAEVQARANRDDAAAD